MSERKELAKEIWVTVVSTAEGLNLLAEEELQQLLNLGVSMSYTMADAFLDHEETKKC